MKLRASTPRRALALLAVAALAAGCGKRWSAPTSDAGAPPTASSPSEVVSVPVVRAEDARAPSPLLAGIPWNVVLVTVDSLRADMPWAGYPRPIAPTLTALHARSIAYSRAYSTSSFTSKSLAGILTGRYPSELSRTGSFFTTYRAKSEFMCTTLAEQDIPCIGGHAHAYFGKGQAGFDHGFAAWKLVPGIAFDYQTDPYVTSDKLTPLASAMLDEAAGRGRPFFAWFHYMDPHDEYKTHAESPHFGKGARDLYDEEVFYTDLWIGKLLDHIEAQPWAPRTIIVVSADHGEAFGEHGLTRHAHEIYDVLVHVPLFFYVPGSAPRTIDEPRAHVDVARTIGELVGARDLPAMQGVSMVAELAGGEAPPHDVVVDLPEDEYNERRRALVHGHHKLIAFGKDVRFALYDLAADPLEKDDLARKQPDLLREMRALYNEASSRIHDVPPVGGIPKH